MLVLLLLLFPPRVRRLGRLLHPLLLGLRPRHSDTQHTSPQAESTNPTNSKRQPPNFAPLLRRAAAARRRGRRRCWPLPARAAWPPAPSHPPACQQQRKGFSTLRSGRPGLSESARLLASLVLERADQRLEPVRARSPLRIATNAKLRAQKSRVYRSQGKSRLTSRTRASWSVYSATYTYSPHTTMHA